MAVEIELAGNLGAGKPRRQTMLLESPASVSVIAEKLGLDLEEVGLIVINGVQSEPEDIVPIDGRLVFFPPMSGG